MRWLIIVLGLALAGPALAVEPDEVLKDPALEARARTLSKELRCLVCRNESIDESNADLARDLRVLVRERLVAGDSDDEAMDFIVSRYGEYVLLRPQTGGANLILWIAGPLALIAALLIGFGSVRRRSGAEPAPDTLSPEEEKRLREILKE